MKDVKEVKEAVKKRADEYKGEIALGCVIGGSMLLGGYCGKLIGYRKGYEAGGKAGAKMIANLIPVVVEECRNGSVNALRNMGALGLNPENLTRFREFYYSTHHVNGALNMAYRIMEAKKFS